MERYPYYYETKRFIVTSHGGKLLSFTADKEEHNVSLSKSSFKRLCIYFDTFDFEPTLSITISNLDPDYEMQKKHVKQLVYFMHRFSNKAFFENQENFIPPFFFWKKSFVQNKMNFTIITSAVFGPKIETIEWLMNTTWNKYSGMDTKVNIKKVNEEDIYSFLVNTPLDTDEKAYGRFWGYFNSKYYKRIIPEKKKTDLISILKLEADLKKQGNLSSVYVKPDSKNK